MKWVASNPNCSICGILKVGSYVKESYCGECIGEKRRARNARRRAERDLPPIGSGRDPKCKECRAVKEPQYKDGSLCGPCKLTKMKKKYRLDREAKGLPPRRSGRNPICKCGATKESTEDAHCKKCISQRRSALTAARAKDPEYLRMRREREIARCKEDALFRRKKLCRKETRNLLRRGLIEAYCCEICGSEKSEVHHVDYNDPWNIRWLCRQHHMAHHAELNKLNNLKNGEQK